MDTPTETPIPALVAEGQEQVLLPALPKTDPTPDLYIPPTLTKEEEDFALALVETGGNIPAAYKMVFGVESRTPTAMGKAMLAANPGIGIKIKELEDSVSEHALISVGAHLNELARIRDLAIMTGQVKAALHAERSRGEAVGFYQRHDNKKGGGTQAVQININMASKHDENI